jgi:ABC-type multidrug transport system fused ATPase/permease subunit
MRRGRRPTTADLSTLDREKGMRTIRKVVPYLWPEGQGWVKRRVVLAMAALVLAKIVSVLTPFLYKAAVDSLTGEGRDDAFLLAIGAVGLTVAYGLARLMNTGFQQLRDAISTTSPCATISPARPAVCRA